MIQDKISLLITDISGLKEKLKGIKKDMKHSEKNENEDYIELKKASKEMKAQVKDLEEAWKSELQSDDHYNTLRELRLKAEEDIAHARQGLFECLAKMPQKPFHINLETESGLIRVQIQPEMKIYLNGKEEKGKF